MSAEISRAFCLKVKEKLFRKKCDTTAKYNITLDTVVENALSRCPIKSPPDYTCHDYRRHYCHFCSDANQIWMVFLSERRKEAMDVSGRNLEVKRYFELIFFPFGWGVVRMKDENRWRNGDDPGRAERGKRGKVVTRWNGSWNKRTLLTIGNSCNSIQKYS